MNKKSHSRHITAKPSARLGAYFGAGLAASLGTPSDAEAAIIFFDVNPDQTIPFGGNVTFGSIDLLNGTYTLNGKAGASFGLAWSGNATSGSVDPVGNIEWGYSGSYVKRLALNDSISGASAWTWSSKSAPGSAYLVGGYIGKGGEWGFSGDSGSVTGFAPLRINVGGIYNYGWAEVTYANTDAFSSYLNNATITVAGFAFEDQVNTAILAGDGATPIPEPGTWAAGAGLFALAVGAHLRRRRERKAAASDALLNLAAGAHGVEKFRADQAA